MSKIKVPKGWILGLSPEVVSATRLKKTSFKRFSRGQVNLSAKMNLGNAGRRKGEVSVWVEGAGDAVHTIADLNRLIGALEELRDIARQMQEYKP